MTWNLGKLNFLLSDYIILRQLTKSRCFLGVHRLKSIGICQGQKTQNCFAKTCVRKKKEIIFARWRRFFDWSKNGLWRRGARQRLPIRRPFSNSGKYCRKTFSFCSNGTVWRAFAVGEQHVRYLPFGRW